MPRSTVEARSAARAAGFVDLGAAARMAQLHGDVGEVEPSNGAGPGARLDSFQKVGQGGDVPATVDCEGLLRAASLRVTRPRVAVLTAVYAHPHADTESITAAARADLGAVSHQAVYDVLRALTTAGLVRRIEPQGSVPRYESRVGDNHHHVVCRTCGVVADVDCAVGDTPCLTASNDNGFVIDEAEVVYWGHCPDCLVARSNMPARLEGSS